MHSLSDSLYIPKRFLGDDDNAVLRIHFENHLSNTKENKLYYHVNLRVTLSCCVVSSLSGV